MSTYNFSAGTITHIRDNILLIKYNVLQPVTVEDIKEITKIRENIIGIKHYHAITDFTNGIVNITDEAKDYIAYQNKNNNFRISDAFITTSMATKIEINLYILFKKPNVRTKTFDSIDKALVWIDSLDAIFKG
ncbi:MAG TPA: hypothetical protein EYG85_11620 [Crocinitomix sp.]|nr:hypothetical protein [Crocinitomix sp.]